MPSSKLRKIESSVSPWNSEVRLLAWLATCISVFSFLFYFQGSKILLYGDAVAHINIARRVFDSKTPGLLQLGTVWLPLPHLLMVPFLISKEMWQKGAGGSIPSMIAYVLAVVGMFRLTRTALSRSALPDPESRIAAWTAALIFALNPNLIYMQSTAMGESLYLAFFVWSVVHFVEGARGKRRSLYKCGLCLGAACITRYDGWFLAAVMCAVLMLQAALSVLRHRSPAILPFSAIAKFLLIAAVAPAIWLAYNGVVYRNPLEFENGPYSAKAIESRNPGSAGHPGTGNPILAGRYFTKAAEDNLAENQWMQRIWIFFLIVASAITVSSLFNKSPHVGVTAEEGSCFGWDWALITLLFLLLPIPFYALSIAYGGVPIFVPQWWPFTHYNTRYGLQLVPAFSLALAIVVCFVLRSEWFKGRLRLISVLTLFAFAAAGYASIWHSGPVCLVEAEVNTGTRTQLQTQLALWLEKLPSDATLLMYLGDHVGAVQRAGIPLEHTINEGNHRVWKQPSDVEGLWERALANPSQYANYVVALEGDPVWNAVQGKHLNEIVEIHVTGQPRAVLYSTR